MIKSKRTAAVIALAAALIMLFSVLFIALETDHDCCGEGCAVCAQVRVCIGFLQNLLTSAALVVAGWCLAALIRLCTDTDCHSAYPHTLIALKVKLSD